MDVPVRVEQDVVGLDVAVDDALLVAVADGAAQLGHPEADGVLCKGFAGDVEAQVAAVHEVDDNVEVLDVLEAVAQIAQEGVVEVLEHAALADDIADALGPYDCDTASVWGRGTGVGPESTFIFAYVLEREGEARVFALDDAHLAKGALADHSQQAEVVQIDLVGKDHGGTSVSHS